LNSVEFQVEFGSGVRNEQLGILTLRTSITYWQTSKMSKECFLLIFSRISKLDDCQFFDFLFFRFLHMKHLQFVQLTVKIIPMIIIGRQL